MEENYKFDLKAVAPDADQLTATVEWRHGMRFTIRYMSRSDFQKLQKDCTIQKYNEDAKARLPTIDPEKLVPAFCRQVVHGWEGVTPTSLSNIVPIDLTKVPEEARTAPIPFSQEQLALIVAKAYELDLFLNQSAMDLTLFKPDHIDELKN